MIDTTSNSCATIWKKLPPTRPVTGEEIPFQPAVSGLPTAKMPTASTPQIPFTKWTGTAPTGSSILALSSANVAQQTNTPATRPMITAPQLFTKAHGAVMATRPARMPLTERLGDGFFVGPNSHIYVIALTPPAAPASKVLTAARLVKLIGMRVDAVVTLPPASSTAGVTTPIAEPGLKPNQPKNRMIVPSTPSGM